MKQQDSRKKRFEKTRKDSLTPLVFSLSVLYLVIIGSLGILNVTAFWETQGAFRELQQTQDSRSYITGYSTQGQGTVGIEILQPCTFLLSEKWNLFSLCAQPQNRTITSVTQPIEDDYNFLLEWNRTAQQFEVYSKRAIRKPFTTVDPNKSYFVYMGSSSRLSIPGDLFDDTSLPLDQKWNTPTYPYLGDGNITRYIQTLGTDYYFYMLWNRPNQLFDVVSRVAIRKPVVTIPVGHGQFIYITNPNGSVLDYDKTDVII